MRIAVLQHPHLDAVWYYRLLPWSFLARQTNAQFSVVSAKQIGQYEAIIGSYDFLIVSRLQNQEQWKAIELAQEYGVKVIADYDDLIWEIPEDNPSARSNEDDNFIYNSIVVLSTVDAVICSTAELQKQLWERFRVKAHLIRNAFNDFTGEIRTDQPEQGDKVRIAWRGSNTHKADLLSAREAFREYDNITFKFFGYRPDELMTKHGGNLPYLDHAHWKQKVSQSFKAISDWEPHYMIYPLQDHVFNRCKSNIAWIEATAMGAVCIAPGYMPEFKAVPCLVYNSPQDLTEWLESIDNGAVHRFVFSEARKELIKSYLLSDINQLRVDVLNGLTLAPAALVDTREGGSSL